MEDSEKIELRVKAIGAGRFSWSVYHNGALIATGVEDRFILAFHTADERMKTLVKAITTEKGKGTP